ncbi:hypothetical protein MKX03_016273 [Papaver bracteatum]|nr:hypothetical protein MKX03_016273 [Papaver bracteatum]
MLSSDQQNPNRPINERILSVLQKSNHINHLKQLQSFLITTGNSRIQFITFKLVRFCIITLSNIDYARLIFNDLRSPNVYLYTAMITAYTSQSDYKSTLLLYRDMVRSERTRPSEFIYPHVLKSCFHETYGVKSVHDHIVKSGFVGYSIVQTSLVDAYLKSESPDLVVARSLFDEMTERNVVSWTAMISGYARLGQIGNAISLFEKMPERDVPSWNSIIAGCTQNGLFTEAISFFKQMVSLDSDYKPNQITVVCILSACGNLGMLQLGRWIHGYIYRNCIIPSPFILNALVDMYGKCGSLRIARRVFDHTSVKSLTTWNSMINCLALHGQSETAITVFGQMINYGGSVKPDEVTFIGLLNACTHGGLVEEGRKYFKLMTEDYRIEPQIQHYGCIIDLLGRAGQFEEAMEVIKEMRMVPDEVVWGSLLNGCKVYRRMDLAEFAVKKLIENNPDHAGYGVMLANVYGDVGKWDEVGKVRKKLKEMGATKTPGCSWIEIDSQVQQFYSADKTHHKTEEIYKMLEVIVGFS